MGRDPISRADDAIARAMAPPPGPPPAEAEVELTAAERAEYLEEMREAVAEEDGQAARRQQDDTARQIDAAHKATGRKGPPGKL